MAPSAPPVPTVEVPEGYKVVVTPIKSLGVIADKYARDGATYYARIVWELTSSCIESYSRELSLIDEVTFEIKALTITPTDKAECTGEVRLDSDQVFIGNVGGNLVACGLYRIYSGEISTQFQASDRSVSCPEAAPTATPFPTRVNGDVLVDSELLENSLRSLGADVEFVGQVVMNQLFGVWPSELTVNGHAVRIYELASRELATEASLTVSSNGYTFTESERDGIIKSVHRDWIDPPRFYLFESSIILYFGSDGKIGTLLDSIGTLFAGQPLSTSGSYGWISVPGIVSDVYITTTRTTPLEHVVDIILNVGHCNEYGDVEWRIEGNEVRMEASMRIADPPLECIGSARHEGDSFNLGSDFEPRVEYSVIVNGDVWGNFIGGQVQQ